VTEFFEWVRPGLLAVLWPAFFVLAAWALAEVLAFVVELASRWL
jgi:hypothetical protein